MPPLLQRFPFGHDNLKNILVRPFKFGMWVYMGNATLTFNFKVTGGLLKVRIWPFFHILAQFSYTESWIILWLIYVIHIYVLCKHAKI